MGWSAEIDDLVLTIGGSPITDPIQSASWSMGRGDWFASLGPSSISFTIVGEQSVDPGDELTLEMGSFPLWTGKVDEVTTTTEPGQPTVTVISGTNFVGQLGEARMREETIATDTMDQQLVEVLSIVDMTATVTVAPSQGIVALDDWVDFTGTVLDWINTAEKYANTIVEVDGEGDLRVCSRTALPNFNQRVFEPTAFQIPNATSLWEMSEASGAIADNISGRTGTAAGTPTYSQDGAWGSTGPDSIAFQKADAADEFTVGDFYDLNAATSWTILGWARWAGSAGSDDTLVSKITGGDGWFIGIDEGSDLFRYQVRESAATTLNIETAAATVPTTEWFMWAVVRDTTETRIYLATAPDYVVTESASATSVAPPNTAASFRWGSRGGTTEWYGGRMQSGAVWDADALTEGQLQRLVDMDLVDLDGALTPASWTQSRGITSVINHWEIGVTTTKDAGSIADYGLRTWDVSDTLDLSGFAYGADLMTIMSEPRPLVTATFHVTGDESGPLVRLVPLSLVRYDDVIWQVLEVSHDIDPVTWSVSLILDRTQSDLTDEVPILPV